MGAARGRGGPALRPQDGRDHVDLGGPGVAPGGNPKAQG